MSLLHGLTCLILGILFMTVFFFFLFLWALDSLWDWKYAYWFWINLGSPNIMNGSMKT